jgi:fumarate hydratase class II
LPEVQPGSSIMPGKVNPVIAESMLMVAAQVIGNDLAVTVGGQAGNFELNVMIPVIAHNLLQSTTLLAASARNFEARLVRGLAANQEHIAHQLEQSLALCTSLAPVIGYDAAADIAKEAAKTGRTVRDVAQERRVLPPDALARALDPGQMTKGGFLGGKPQAAGG